MNWNIQTELPLWLVPLGLGLAVFIAWLSYFSPRAKELFPYWARVILITLRSLSLLFIFFLFLGPKIIRRLPSRIKPVFILAADNSTSMKRADSLSEGSVSYINMIGELRSALDDRFDVYTYLFGDKITRADVPDLNDQASDFSKLFDELAVKHYADPVNGMLVLSDGIFNQGANPMYADDVFPFRIHAMGIGDTTRHPDLRIREVNANEIVYMDTRFPVEVFFESWNLPDTVARLTVFDGSKPILDTVARFFPGENSGIMRFNLNAEKPGVQTFRISLTGAVLDSNPNNNAYSLTVEIVEHKAKILLLYLSPHPDVSALTTAIGEMANYELESSDIRRFTGRMSDYQLVIFHQLPGHGASGAGSLLQEFRQEQLPGWFILGGQSDLNAINQLGLGIRMDQNTGMMEDFEGEINRQFSLFKANEFLPASMKEWPPLKGPLTSLSLAPRTEILMYQKIKSIKLDYPLLCFTKSQSGKHGFLFGEGIWRWRLAEYLESGNSEQFKGLVKSIVQYLVVDEDKERFRLDVPKTLSETEKLVVKAQVYNESYEPLQGVIINFRLIDSMNQVSAYEMRPSNSGYSLLLDPLKPGVYNYTAETSIGQENFSRQGKIVVKDVQLEEMLTTADFSTLRKMAEQKGGKFYTENDYNNLLLFAKDLEPGEESVRIESKWTNLAQMKYLLFFIVFLLTLEWLLRRWFGTR